MNAAVSIPRVFLAISAALLALLLPRGTGARVLHDDVLFDADPSRIAIPYGSFRMLRSTGSVTQLLVSERYSLLTIYTDRENSRDGAITASAVERIQSVRVTPRPLDQGEFIIRTVDLLLRGDTAPSGDLPFPGLEAFYRSLEGPGKVLLQMRGAQVRVTVPMTGTERGIIEYRLTLSAREGTCVIRILQKRAATGETLHLYPVRIVETGDRHLMRIIREQYYRFLPVSRRQPAAGK
jgi:hypothetical protein